MKRRKSGFCGERRHAFASDIMSRAYKFFSRITESDYEWHSDTCKTLKNDYTIYMQEGKEDHSVEEMVSAGPQIGARKGSHFFMHVKEIARVLVISLLIV